VRALSDLRVERLRAGSTIGITVTIVTAGQNWGRGRQTRHEKKSSLMPVMAIAEAVHGVSKCRGLPTRLHVAEPLGGIAEANQPVHAQTIRHAQEQVRRWLRAMLHVSPGR
jgi:hypothetical protein